MITLTAMPAQADDRVGAFCEVTPCLPGPVTTSKLAAERRVGAVACKQGENIGVDSQQRVQYCTTARDVDVDGLPVAAKSYTLFHPSGKIYQTHARKKFERTLKDGSKITCGVDVVSIADDGTLLYCKVGAAYTVSAAIGGAKAGGLKASVGDGIAFHAGGQLAGLTIDEPYTSGSIPLPAKTSISFDDKGNLAGGYLKNEMVAWGMTINYEFGVHPNGKPKLVNLRKPVKLAGHEFPDFAKLAFRDDGSLEAAEYVEARGFMIHGEPWEDTRTMTFDKTGKVTSTHLEHYQAKDPPPKFRK